MAFPPAQPASIDKSSAGSIACRIVYRSTISGIMTLNLTNHEARALVQFLHRTIDFAPIPWHPARAVAGSSRQARTTGATTGVAATAAGRRRVKCRAREGTMEGSMKLELGAIIAALHDSEINGEVSWFYDGVWRVRLGDSDKAIAAEATLGSADGAAEWLRANPVRRYPHSEFARLYPCTANDP
ncbi:MAG TPA: hypothetical protein VGM07_17855 [Stellaceae bacterium]|jgi:hypothetical protein